MRYAANMRMAVRNVAQRRYLNDFLDFKYINGKELAPTESEHKKFQPVFTHQACALINRV
jgi:hypothetical protein